jgi:hypothetical protein
MHHLTKSLTLVFLFLLSSLSYAQENIININDDNKHPGSKDSLYIRDYSELLMFGIYTSAPTLEKKITPVDTKMGKYSSDFRGNLTGTLGFSIGYKVLGFSYGFKIPVDPTSIDSLGKSSYSTLGLKVRKKAFTLSLDYRKYQGFYDSYTTNFNTSLPDSTPFYIRPDMAVKSYSATGLWNFSWKKYSFSAPITYCDRQVKTRCGFLLKADISYLGLSSDSSFISATQQVAFSDFGRVKTVDAVVYKTGPGFGMNLVFFKRMYFAMNLFVMHNNLIYRYTNETNNQSAWRYDTNYFLDGGAGIGYSSKHFYVGLRASGENNVIRLQGAKVQTTFGVVCFDLGFRLKAPGVLRKSWEKTLTRYLGL